MTLLSLLLLATSVPQAPLPQAPVHSVKRVVQVMGTTLSIELEGPTRAQALAASELAIAAVEQVEASLSTWRSDSLLSQLAQSPQAEWFELTPQVGAILQRAFHWAAASEGSFDPAIAPLVRTWDLRGTGRFPTQAEREQALAASGVRHFRLDLPRRIMRLHAGTSLEEGGFGKGAALDAARQALGSSGVRRATLDLGGQVMFLTPESEVGTTPPLAIAHPDRRELPVALLRISSGSCASSGNSERGLQVQGKRIGHLLDPRTGTPADDFGSVTVWCPKALDADCLSTALYVLGPDAGLRFAEHHENVEAVFVLRDGNSLRIRASEGLRPYLTTIDADVPIEWNLPLSLQSDCSK